MRLPGFTAENSFSGTSANYKMAGTLASGEIGGSVMPQYFFCHGNICCNEWGYCIHRGQVLM